MKLLHYTIRNTQGDVLTTRKHEFDEELMVELMQTKEQYIEYVQTRYEMEMEDEYDLTDIVVTFDFEEDTEITSEPTHEEDIVRVIHHDGIDVSIMSVVEYANVLDMSIEDTIELTDYSAGTKELKEIYCAKDCEIIGMSYTDGTFAIVGCMMDRWAEDEIDMLNYITE